MAAAAGQVNKTLVATLQRLGCNALGLSGVDGRLLQARRKNALRVVENGRQRVVRDDYSGQLEIANGGLLRLLLEAGYTPVVAPLALGSEGEPLNVDGDRVAALLARTVCAETLVILSNGRVAGGFPGREQPPAPRSVRKAGRSRGNGPGTDEEEGTGRARGAGRRRPVGDPGRLAPAAPDRVRAER